MQKLFYEYLHQQVRTKIWVYSPDEALSNDELIREKYQEHDLHRDIRLAQTHRKTKIWQLLNVENRIGMKLTDAYAMWPGASVSGWYFSHPESKYFAVAQIQKDQVEDYAKRRGMSVSEVERWLAPNLGYEP